MTLTIGGSDSGGGAGIQVDIKAFWMEAGPLKNRLTVTTAEHSITKDVPAYSQDMRKMNWDVKQVNFESVLEKYERYLRSRDLAETVSSGIQEFQRFLNFAVDRSINPG